MTVLFEDEERCDEKSARMWLAPEQCKNLEPLYNAIVASNERCIVVAQLMFVNGGAVMLKARLFSGEPAREIVECVNKRSK